MKKLFVFLFILSCVQCFSQNPANYYYRPVRERSIAQMVDSSFHVPRYNGTPVGLRVGSSVNSGALGIDSIGHGSFFYSGNKWRNQGSFSFSTRIIHGGVVTWDSLLVFSVSPAFYEINGAFYTSVQTQLTLDAAHATLNRIDLIYLDSTGPHKATGTASANPAEPNLPLNSIRLTAISVLATATTPPATVDTVVIYDENVEWTGSTTSVTADFNNMGNPFHFLRAASVEAITSSSIVKFTRTSAIKITDYETLRFWIKLKAQFNPNVYLQIYWMNAGVKVSTTVDLTNGSYGFVRTFTSTYMQINIPVSAFGFPSTTNVDGLWFQSTGTNGSGFYLDWIQLQTGIPQAPPVQNQKFGEGDVLAAGNRSFNQNNKTFEIYNAPTFQISSNSIVRIFNNASSSGIVSPNGNNSVQTTNTISGLRVGASTNFIDAYADSTQAQKKISYNGNIHSTFGPFSHVTKKYADSVASAAAAVGIDNVLSVGQVLTTNRTIDANGFDFNINGDFGGFTNDFGESGAALKSTSDANVGVWGISNTDVAGVVGQNSSASAGSLQSQKNIANNSATFTTLHLQINSTNTPQNGFGQKIKFVAETTGGNEDSSNLLISKWTDATHATRTSQFIIDGINSGTRGDIISFEGNKRTVLYGRLEPQQGADVASVAGAIAVGLDGNVFEITGTNAITLISNLNWQNGSEITLIFTSTATLTDGTANSGTDIGMELAGNVNFVATADDVVTLVLCEMGGTQRWREKCRSVN